ncbi:hypothetical protein B1H10_01285 [candidate division KSB1 bacterium 4484_188]|nr:MAG: hypothetical protein B1H10_01285 [candidate division KSB1 bacterium 4484_188]
MVKLIFRLTIFIALICLLFFACSSGIEFSPDPGILRITLESDQADTTITIVTDTLTVSDNDVFRITIFQGKVYQDSTFTVLYPTIESNSQEERAYNLITRENHQYQKFTIFESYVPPFKYNKIQFGLDSDFLKLRNFDKIQVVTPNNFFLILETDFEVHENRMTEVNLRVSPFENVVRYKDTYIFAPIMEVVGIKSYE